MTRRVKLEEVFQDENLKKLCHDQALQMIERHQRDERATLPPLPLLSHAGPASDEPVMQFHENFDFEYTRCMCELYFVDFVSQ
jgi:hypothetical protein